MSAIVTITFNPALDKSVSIDELISEKKLKCSEPHFEPGGGGINVARAIKKLGGDALAIYPGGGGAGAKIARLLQEESVSSVMTPISGETRENLIVADNKSGKQYLFDMPGPHIKPNEWLECLNEIGKVNDVGFIVVSGSLPPGVPLDVFDQISAIAREKNAKLIVDTSGEALQHAVRAGVFLVKPNQRELGLLAGREVSDSNEVTAAALEVIAGGSCGAVVVSMGPLGALLVTETGIWHILPPVHKVKSTVGAGDSLVAGIVYRLAQNEPLAEAVKYGVASGSAATLNPGTQLCNRAETDKLFKQIQVISCDLTFNQHDFRPAQNDGLAEK